MVSELAPRPVLLCLLLQPGTWHELVDDASVSYMFTGSCMLCLSVAAAV